MKINIKWKAPQCCAATLSSVYIHAPSAALHILTPQSHLVLPWVKQNVSLIDSFYVDRTADPLRLIHSSSGKSTELNWVIHTTLSKLTLHVHTLLPVLSVRKKKIHVSLLCFHPSSVTTSTTTSWPPTCPTCWSTATSQRSLSCGARGRSPTSSTSRISTSTPAAPSTTSCSTRCSRSSCGITPARRSTCRTPTSTGPSQMLALLTS